MTSTAPSVAIVIPVHNGVEHITEQLDAVAASAASLSGIQIVVVDNRSTDGSDRKVAEWAKAAGLDVQIVRADERQGEPYARNLGWRSTTSELILFCDADDVVGEPWVSALVAALSECEYATGPLDTWAINAPDVAGQRGHALFSAIATLHKVVPFAHGANMAFRRTTLERLGGFDESFLIGCDIEIAVRAWRLGIPLVWVPQALVHYRLRSTPTEVYRQACAYGRSHRSIDARVPELVESGPRAILRYVRRLAWLVRHVPEVRHRRGRLNWMWVAGQIVGEAKALR